MAAFKIQPKTNTFKAQVSFKDIDDNGRSIRHSIEMEFKRLTRKSYDSVLSTVETPKDEDGEPIKLSGEERLELDADLVMGLVTNWQIQDAVGEPFPFSRDNVLVMLDSYPSLAVAVVLTAASKLNGELARKN